MQTNELTPNPNQQVSTPQQSNDVSSVGQELTQGENNWLIFGLVFFCLAALGITGVLAYQNHQLKKQVENLSRGTEVTSTKALQPTPTSTTSTPSPTPTIDPVANWKTYTSEKYNFSFKYPSSWDYQKVSSKTQNTIDYLQITLAKSEYFNPIPKGNPLILISITETTDKNKLSVYQNTEIIKTIVIGGITAEERKHKTPTVDSKYITFFNNNAAYEFESRVHSQDPEHQNIFDQILSTFQFIN